MGLGHGARDSLFGAGVDSVLIHCSFRSINLLLCTFSHDLFATKFIRCLPLLDGKVADRALDTFDVVDVEVDAFLQYI